jgi:hypothetical protein
MGIWLIVLVIFIGACFFLYLGMVSVGNQQRKEKEKYYIEYCAFMDKHYDKITADELWLASRKCVGKWKR